MRCSHGYPKEETLTVGSVGGIFLVGTVEIPCPRSCWVTDEDRAAWKGTLKDISSRRSAFPNSDSSRAADSRKAELQATARTAADAAWDAWGEETNGKEADGEAEASTEAEAKAATETEGGAGETEAEAGGTVAGDIHGDDDGGREGEASPDPIRDRGDGAKRRGGGGDGAKRDRRRRAAGRVVRAKRTGREHA